MATISPSMLEAYLDDALSDAETARVEQELRTSEALRDRLRDILQERDRGEHSVGAVWRRERLTCPTREQLGSYLLEVLDAEYLQYLDFHLKVVACPSCLANLDDLKEHQTGPTPQTHHRRRKYYQSSAGLLRKS